MAKAVQQAEADVVQAHVAIAEDLCALKGWFRGVMPFKWLLAVAPNLGRRRSTGIRREAALPFNDDGRASLLPLFVMTLGVGWLLHSAAHRRRTDDGKFERGGGRCRCRR